MAPSGFRRSFEKKYLRRKRIKKKLKKKKKLTLRQINWLYYLLSHYVMAKNKSLDLQIKTIALKSKIGKRQQPKNSQRGLDFGLLLCFQTGKLLETPLTIPITNTHLRFILVSLPPPKLLFKKIFLGIIYFSSKIHHLMCNAFFVFTNHNKII